MVISAVLFAVSLGAVHGSEPGLRLPRIEGQRINPRYDVWQAQHPYVLAGFMTHTPDAGGELDLDYFLGSGLNTAWDGRCNYGSSRAFPDLKGLPIVYTVYADRQPDLAGFIADFQKVTTPPSLYQSE